MLRHMLSKIYVESLPNNLMIFSLQVTKAHAGDYTCTPYNTHGTSGTSGIMQVMMTVMIMIVTNDRV